MAGITEQQKEAILTSLESGLSLRNACRQADIQDPIQIRRLIERDPAFESQYARAREEGYKRLADDLIEVSDDTSIPSDHRRIMVDTRKWMLSKMLPKLYGDRLDLHHTGTTKAVDALTDAELAAVVAARTAKT
jgi:hypothetical protein